MARCEGQIPEMTDVIWEREMLRDENGKETGEYVQHDKSVTHPAHRCKEPAVAKAVDVQQVRCDQGELHWKITGEKKYCMGCAEPGKAVLEDGTVSNHPIQAL